MIYAKLDWYSVVLYNYSVDDILKRLNIYNEIFEDLTSNGYERSQGFSSVFVFSYAGISIELRFDDYLTTDRDSLFSTKYKKIRLDISGTGLDYLRQFMLPDTEFTKSDFWGENQKDYNVTRSDFAFDFVNYKPEFLDSVLNWIKDQERGGDLIKNDSRLTVGFKRGIQYSYRCGCGQKTLYLGSPRGDKMVRIYDKFLEQTQNGVFKHGRDSRFEKEPTIDSWFRIELQSRRKCATQFLFGCSSDISLVLRAIFDDYLIRDKNGVPLPCMVDLYDWEKLPEIVKIENFIQFREGVLERSRNYITGSAYRSIRLFVLHFGIQALIDELNLRTVHDSISDSSRAVRSVIGFNLLLGRSCLEQGVTVDSLPGRMNDDADMYLLKGGSLSLAELGRRARALI